MVSRDADYVIQKAYLHAQRKDTPPGTGTPKYEALLEMADSFQKEWASEPDTEWSSLYDKVTLGTISATDTYGISSDINYIIKEDDPIYTTDGTDKIYYSLVSPTELEISNASNPVAEQGGSLVFKDAFTADSTDFGWDLVVPAQLLVGDITQGTDIVEVDDPMWLAWMMGAEFVRNDIVRQNQYSNMLNHAQLLMTKMKESNVGQVGGITIDYPIMGRTW